MYFVHWNCILYNMLCYCMISRTFRLYLVTKTISTSTWDCTPDRIYGKWINEIAPTRVQYRSPLRHASKGFWLYSASTQIGILLGYVSQAYLNLPLGTGTESTLILKMTALTTAFRLVTQGRRYPCISSGSFRTRFMFIITVHFGL
jgi:hypothetical protein